MHPSQHKTEDERVADLLHALNQARPAPGLEARLMQRLAAEANRDTRPRSWHWGMLTFAVPAAATVCAVCAFLMHPRSTAPVAAVQVARASTHAQPNPAARAPRMLPPASAGPDAEPQPAHLQAPRLESGAAARTLPPSASSPQQAGRDGSSQQEPSFPAPEMALTEQERLLLQIAHRKDPVQLALLDKHERTLADLRERAESQRFFAPKPLPANLQSEIDAAVKSQYTVDETTEDRTNP